MYIEQFIIMQLNEFTTNTVRESLIPTISLHYMIYNIFRDLNSFISRLVTLTLVLTPMPKSVAL
jgi:hypothetical protein